MQRILDSGGLRRENARPDISTISLAKDCRSTLYGTRGEALLSVVPPRAIPRWVPGLGFGVVQTVKALAGVLLLIAVGDFFYYWTHRWMHLRYAAGGASAAELLRLLAPLVLPDSFLLVHGELPSIATRPMPAIGLWKVALLM